MRWIALAALAAALTGCGGGKSTDALTDYLPEDTHLVVAIDVKLAREEAELDPGADVLDLAAKSSRPKDDGARTRTVATAMASAFAPLQDVMRTLRLDDPTLAAFDGAKITAAASNGGLIDGGLRSAIRTTQSFDAIAEGLEKAGWKRDGDSVVSPKHGLVGRVTDAGGGVVLLTSRGVDTDAMRDSPPGGPANLDDMIGDARGSVRVAFFKPAQGGCVTAFGGWETSLGRAAEIRLRVAGTPDPDAFRDGQFGGMDIGEAEPEGARAPRHAVRAQEQRHDAAAALDHPDAGLRAALSLPALAAPRGARTTSRSGRIGTTGT